MLPTIVKYRWNICINYICYFVLAFILLISYTQAQAAFTFKPKWQLETSTTYVQSSEDLLSYTKSFNSSYTSCVYVSGDYDQKNVACYYSNGSVNPNAAHYYMSCNYPGAPATDGYKVRPNTVCYSNQTPSCPADSTWNSTTGVCEGKCVAKAGKPFSYLMSDASVKTLDRTEKEMCFDQCLATDMYFTQSVQQTSTRPADWWVGGKYTGTVCSDSQKETDKNVDTSSPGTTDQTNNETPEAKCLRQGKSFGHVNEMVVCIDSPSITKNENISKSEIDKDGKKVETDTHKNITTNEDGTVTVTTTTTTKTTNSDGTTSTSTSTSQSKQDKDGFCEENPNSSICGNGEFGGTCDAGFTCDGDPIQCAIAKSNYDTYCTFKVDKDNPFAAIGNSITPNGGLSDDTKNALNLGEYDVSSMIKEESFIGASCWGDETISVFGRSFDIPFSKLCEIMNAMGTVVLIGAWLAAGRIVFGRG